jgi:hypothetical protein
MDLEKTRDRLLLVGTTVATINSLNTMQREYRNKWNASKLYTARIASDAYVYPVLMEWLNEKSTSKAVKFDSTYRGVKTYYDGMGYVKADIGGHAFKINIEKPNKDDGVMPDADEDLATFLSGKIVFTCHSRRGLTALKTFLEELTEERKTREREIYLWTPGNYGWSTNPLPDRPMESVFLPPGVKEDFCNDLGVFFENESHYRRIGVPWHRGYLFHGPPGNGKTSLVAATASEYRMHLYNLPLSSVKDDKELTTKINDISPRSILLLEDIDIFSKTMNREQKDSGPTLAGLLNALDGVGTPHGLLTFMTTNRLDALDEALIRPGRIDKRIEMVGPVEHQIKSMFYHAYDETLGCDPKEFESMAELTEVFKRFTLDPESARMEIKA